MKKKGEMVSTLIILAALIIVFIIKRQLAGFIFNYEITHRLNVFSETTRVVLPFICFRAYRPQCHRSARIFEQAIHGGQIC